MNYNTNNTDLMEQCRACMSEKGLPFDTQIVSDGQIINSRISAAEKFQFSISLGLAKYYSDAVSDNVKRALEQKLRKGEWPAKAPFGYKNIRDPNGKSNIIVDDHAAHIIKQTFELYASKAYSMQTLCKKINAEYGTNWSKGLLDHTLKNTFYHGVMIWNQKSYPHSYPPIITQELFELVQQVKNGFNKQPIKYAGLPYIYRGLMRCGDCGLAITPEKHKGHVYYHCTQYNGKHDAKWLREEEVTKQLGKIFKKLQVPEDVLQKITETLASVHQDKIAFQNQQFDMLTKKQKDLTKMMDNLYLDKLKGRITDDHYDRFYENFKDEANDISIRLNQLQEAKNNYYITAKYLLNLTNRAYDLFVGSEVEDKRHLIKLVLSNLETKEGKVFWELHKPFDTIVEFADRQAWCAR